MKYSEFNFRTIVVNNIPTVFIPVKEIKDFFKGFIPTSGDPSKPLRAAIITLQEMDEYLIHKTDDSNAELLINAKGLWSLAVMFPIGLSNMDELYELIEYMIEKGERTRIMNSHEIYQYIAETVRDMNNGLNEFMEDMKDQMKEQQEKLLQTVKKLERPLVITPTAMKNIREPIKQEPASQNNVPEAPEISEKSQSVPETKPAKSEDSDLQKSEKKPVKESSKKHVTDTDPLPVAIPFSEVKIHPEKDQIMEKLKSFSYYLLSEIKDGNIKFSHIGDTKGYTVSMGDILVPVETAVYIINRRLRPFHELTYNKNDRSDVISLTKIMKAVNFEKVQIQVYSEEFGLESRPYFKRPINKIIRSSDDTWDEITGHSLLHYLNPEQTKFLSEFEKIVTDVSTMPKTETNTPCTRSMFIAKWSEIMNRKYSIVFSDDRAQMVKEFKDVEIEPIPKVNYQPLVMAFMRNDAERNMGLAVAKNLQQESK